MATGKQHAVCGILLHLLLATGTLSTPERNVHLLTDFIVATQSSNVISNGMLWSAEKVLDGCYDKTCTAHTRGEPHNWIRLDLGNVYKISSVVISAVTEDSCLTCPQNGLTDINIEMSKILGSPQCVFTTVATLNQNISVKIQQTNDGHSLPDSRYIALRKAHHNKTIYIFGDCPDNYCGRNCSQFCFCKTPLTYKEKANEESCHNGCLEGWEGEMCDKRKCMEGYFGLTCRYECRCIGGCDPWTGECIGADRRCYATFSGSSCQRKELTPVYLKSGLPTDGNQSTCTNVWTYQILLKYTIRPSYIKITYKSDNFSNTLRLQMPSSIDNFIPSQSPKSIGCSDKKEHFFQFNDVNVSNLIIQNLTGELCEIQFFACSPGTFGSDCSSNCYCLDRKPCNSIDGTCPEQKCEPYWEGKACDSRCSIGTFGKNCSNLCHCHNNESCNHQTGKCPGGCTPGWTDIACNKPYYGGEDEHHYVPVEELDGRITIVEQNCTDCDNQTATNGDKEKYDPDEKHGDSSTSNVITGYTDQNVTEFDSQTTDQTGLVKIFIISGSIGSAVILTLVVGILCLFLFRKKKESNPISKADVLEEHKSLDSPQHIYEEVQEAASYAEHHSYYNVQSHIYETPVNRGINVPATQFTELCKKLFVAPKDGKPPLFYAFQSLQSSEHVYERADQGVKENADGPRLSYKALVLRHHTLPEQAETSFGQSSRKILKVNDISFMVSDDSVTSGSLWKTLVEHEITTCVHIGEPIMKKDEKLTFESLTIEWMSWKETDSVTECVLIAESLESKLITRLTMLSCATWEEFMEVPIDLPGVISLTEYLYRFIDKGGSVMIQCEQTINKAVLLSVVSAILFKMKSTGLVDILGPVHDARLGSLEALQPMNNSNSYMTLSLSQFSRSAVAKKTLTRHQRT